MFRYLPAAFAILLALLVIGGVGAFLLFVPLFPIASVFTITLALVLMFLLGTQAAMRANNEVAKQEEPAIEGRVHVLGRHSEPVHEPEAA